MDGILLLVNSFSLAAFAICKRLMSRWQFSQGRLRHGEVSSKIWCHLGISSTPDLAVFWAGQLFWYLPKSLLLFLIWVSPITAS